MKLKHNFLFLHLFFCINILYINIFNPFYTSKYTYFQIGFNLIKILLYVIIINKYSKEEYIRNNKPLLLTLQQLKISFGYYIYTYILFKPTILFIGNFRINTLYFLEPELIFRGHPKVLSFMPLSITAESVLYVGFFYLISIYFHLKAMWIWYFKNENT